MQAAELKTPFSTSTLKDITCRAVRFTCGYIVRHKAELARLLRVTAILCAIIAAFAAGLWVAVTASAYVKGPFTMLLAKEILTGIVPTLMLIASLIGAAFLLVIWPFSRVRYLSNACAIARDLLIAAFVAAFVMSSLGPRPTPRNAPFPKSLPAPVNPVPAPQLR